MAQDPEFPTLDLLERYRMRTAYMVLLLGARSREDFRRLHDEVIPKNCRLPESHFRFLIDERDRLLALTGKEVAEDGRAATDVRLMREFDLARINPALQLQTLVGFYFDHLASKSVRVASGGVVCQIYMRDPQAVNLLHYRCSLLSFAGSMHLNTYERAGRTRLEANFSSKRESSLDVERMQSLLTLPAWHQLREFMGGIEVTYIFDVTDLFNIAPLRSGSFYTFDHAMFLKVIAFLHERGIPLVLTQGA